MQNDPELDGKYLGTISKDFVIVSESIKEASYQVRKQGFSDYPIFPISKKDVSIGQLLIAKQDAAIEWNYNITYLDEFVQRKIVAEDKLDDFKKIYKDPEEFCCLFVMDGDFTRFLFIPYPVD
ncbi:MAG: hypothetical protein IIB82_00920 [Bacteroidetes bacterium]|nr:hypothetical protein [Bacteroidota bacterium]